MSTPPSAIEEENEKDKELIKEISAILSSYFPPEQFEDKIINYMTRMIYIDRPDNEHDLRSLIGDYLSDQLRYPEDKTLQICKEIFHKIQKNKIKGTRKAIIAERLQNPIRLNDIKVGSGNTIT